MARHRNDLTAPREHSPDLPAVLEDHSGLRARDDLEAVRIELDDGDVEAPHSRIAESRIHAASLARFDLTGAALTDVAVDGLSAVEVVARDGRWRNVVVSGGRIGTLDAFRAEWDGVTLRGLRIDYLALASAEVSDVLIVDCTIGTLDVPAATLTRVRFEDSRADELDTRGLRAKDLDLRGLEVVSFTDVRSLTGATLEERQAELHAVAFAQALGIRVQD